MKLGCFLLLVCFILGGAYNVNAAVPVTTDSRIKTLVYNESDVFSLMTHYGYQSSVEFSDKESVQTVSIGDRVAWQIVPSGHRLFIRALEENAHTNMTIVTNKRAYQFDLRSTGGGDLKSSEELSYVVRFYYPNEDKSNLFSRPIEARKAIAVVKQPKTSFNTNYTYTGPDILAPKKMFDNGRATFIKLATHPAGIQPRLFVVAPDKSEIPVKVSPSENGFSMIGQVSRNFVARYGKNEYICIHNEQR